jgi:3-hydroxyacyl-[acyl-carrier-protein] dehydratase
MTQSDKTTGVVKFQELGIDEIKKILPHRYPFLLVDRIVEMDDRRVVGIKNVTANEPFFQGHFPQKSVMPGVLMIEAIAQTAGVLMLSKDGRPGRLAYLVAVNEARFRKLVVPGDQLRLEAEILKVKAKVGILRGVAKVGQDVACEAEIMFTFAD